MGTDFTKQTEEKQPLRKDDALAQSKNYKAVVPVPPINWASEETKECHLDKPSKIQEQLSALKEADNVILDVLSPAPTPNNQQPIIKDDSLSLSRSQISSSFNTKRKKKFGIGSAVLMSKTTADLQQQMTTMTPTSKKSAMVDRAQEICEKLETNATNNEELDIYQVTAFMKYYRPNEFEHRMKYIYCVIKAVICALIQTVGMVSFLSYTLSERYLKMEESGCAMNASSSLRILATLFSAYISLSIVGIFREIRNQGLYEHTTYVPPFVSNGWIYLGFYCNLFTLLCATYGSFLLIYTADSTMTIVLNSVALYFIVKIDDNLVDFYEYRRIAKWMKDEFKFADWFKDEWFEETKGNHQWKDMCGLMKIQVNVSGRKGGYGCYLIKLALIFCGGIFVHFAFILGVIGCVVAPFIIAVCG